MANMIPTKTPIAEQDPEVRNKNFEEVTLGYKNDEAVLEADRCLQCKHQPCVAGCPVNIPIPQFIQQIYDGKLDEAYNIITSENMLPSICGRVCPQESQCEAVCVMGIKHEPVAIGRLERFVGDYKIAKNEKIEHTEPKEGAKKVAVVGSGPAGITAAGELANRGYAVTLFEALHETGGVLSYGIPDFRLPSDIIEKEIDNIIKNGVKIETNVIIGKSLTIEDLQNDGFEAIFLGSGAGLPRFMNIPGENLNGVYSANEFLTRNNLMKAYKFPKSATTPILVGKAVAVIGGGNVAMDAARTALRLGSEKVYIIYRRSEKELPARDEEVEHAKEEGINFKLLTNPIQILGDEGRVSGMECLKMELGEPDDSGRRRPVPVEGSNYTINVDTVIVAIGQSPNKLISDTTPGLDVQSWGGIIVNEQTLETTKKGVFAGGDNVSGAATVILAMEAGKKAAQSIDKMLKDE